MVQKPTGSRNLMKTCEHSKFLGHRARGLVSSDIRHHTFQGADFVTLFCNKVENSLINKKITNYVQIGVLICTVAIAGSARPRTIRTIV